ncbi:MAG: hypothetical protein OXU23_03600 [Candidatus Poribacteria bacterium]|nr:hypothetical protein [Candidatus Poribacteria bacterium]
MLLGKRVITPDGEAGFISDVYTDNMVDVDILEDDAETPEHTTTICFDKAEVKICDDQAPQLNDITPFGQVVCLGILADGIIEACVETGYDGRKSCLWLSDKRFEGCPDYIEKLFGNWTAPSYFSKLLPHFDLDFNDDGCIDPKPLLHEQIPYESHLRVELTDGDTQFWNARVDTDSKIDSVTTDAGKEINTLAALRAMNIKSAELQSSYKIQDFDR